MPRALFLHIKYSDHLLTILQIYIFLSNVQSLMPCFKIPSVSMPCGINRCSVAVMVFSMRSLT